MGEESDGGDPSGESRSSVHEATPEFGKSVLEREHVYESLAHVRRRYLCYLLCGRSELQVNEAVAAIAEWEADGGTEPSTSTRDRIRLSLLHSHIPKLRDTGVVDFDNHSGTLVPGENAEAVLTALQAVGKRLSPGPTDTEDSNETA